MKNDKRTNNDLQNIEQQIPTKTEVNSDTPGGLAVPAPHVAPVVLLLNDHLIWKSCWTPVYVNKYK